MTQDQITIFAILAATIFLFLWGRWRHDVVALASLLACVFAGLVPVENAFIGLSHPAVITVACVLVLSAGLQSTGAIDVLAQRLLPKSAGRHARHHPPDPLHAVGSRAIDRLSPRISLIHPSTVFHLNRQSAAVVHPRLIARGWLIYFQGAESCKNVALRVTIHHFLSS